MKKNKPYVCWGFSVLAFMMYGSFSYAQNISFQDAERQLLQRSYSGQAFQSLEQASKLEAEAIKGIGLPRIDLNVRAYAFRNELDIPLGAVKNNLEQSLSSGLNNKIDEFNLDQSIADPLKESLKQPIRDGVGLIPDSTNVVLEDQVVRPSVSVMMPLYTGGLTRSAKEVATIQAGRSELSNQQQQDTQRFELIQAYFSVQLQK